MSPELRELLQTLTRSLLAIGGGLQKYLQQTKEREKISQR